MDRRGRVSKSNGETARKRKRNRLKRRDSDDSDEDYVVGEDESENDNSEEYCDSSSQDFSDESGGGSKKPVRSKPANRSKAADRRIKRKLRKHGNSRVSDDIDSDDVEGDDDDDDFEDEEFVPDGEDDESISGSGSESESREPSEGCSKNVEKRNRRKRSTAASASCSKALARQGRKRGVSRVSNGSEEGEENEDDDAEFMLDLNDELEDGEESRKRKKRVARSRSTMQGSSKNVGGGRKRNGSPRNNGVYYPSKNRLMGNCKTRKSIWEIRKELNDHESMKMSPEMRERTTVVGQPMLPKKREDNSGSEEGEEEEEDDDVDFIPDLNEDMEDAEESRKRKKNAVRSRSTTTTTTLGSSENVGRGRKRKGSPWNNGVCYLSKKQLMGNCNSKKSIWEIRKELNDQLLMKRSPEERESITMIGKPLPPKPTSAKKKKKKKKTKLRYRSKLIHPNSFETYTMEKVPTDESDGEKEMNVQEGRAGASRRVGGSSVADDADFVVEDEKESNEKKGRAGARRGVGGSSDVNDADFVLEEEGPNEKKGRAGPRRGISGFSIDDDADFVVEEEKQGNEKKGRAGMTRGVGRSSDDDDDDFVVEEEEDSTNHKARKGRIASRRRTKKKAVVHSDSDFVDSGYSDSEYQMSEEEKDFVRELASNVNLTIGLRSSTAGGSTLKSLRNTLESKKQQQGTCTKKGKEKVDDLQLDVGKQVCGICLSEEQKDVVRGTLNSCFHYFCFTCIMEWSKVESRCPICKQRFTTISKEGRSSIGIGLRKTVIQVPRRDQVYQPSEEEMRDYLDPYENVVCMECQQGCDDSLMLLCDICDSPAHTYCVGLGREVPEGNWYCEGCRSSDPVTSNSLVQNALPEWNTGNCGPSDHSTGRVDASTELQLFPLSPSQHSLSEQLLPSRIDVLASPRCHFGENIQAASPRSGGGPSTVSERRRLRRRIHNLISSYRMSGFAERNGRTNEPLNSGLVNEINVGVEQNSVNVENLRSVGNGYSCPVAFEARVEGSEISPVCCNESPSCSVQVGDAYSSRTNQKRKLPIYDLNALPSSDSMDDSLSAEHEQEGINFQHNALWSEQQSKPTCKSGPRLSPCNTGEGCSNSSIEEAKNKVEPW